MNMIRLIALICYVFSIAFVGQILITDLPVNVKLRVSFLGGLACLVTFIAQFVLEVRHRAGKQAR